MTTKVNSIDVEQALQPIQFPKSKTDLISAARQQNIPDQIISALQDLPDREYRDAADAARESFSSDEGPSPGNFGLDSCDD